MALLLIVSDPILRDTDIDVLGLVGRREEGNGIPVIPADVASVTMRVFENTDQVGTTENLVIADVILDPPLNGDLWDEDVVGEEAKAIGFNFLVPIDRLYLSEGTKNYFVQFDIVLTNGDHCHGVVKIPTKKLPEDG